MVLFAIRFNSKSLLICELDKKAVHCCLSQVSRGLMAVLATGFRLDQLLY